MESRCLSILLAAGLSALVSACIPSEAPEPAEAEPANRPRQLTTTQELVEEWKRMTGNATNVVATSQHYRLVQALADASSDALMPLLDMVADDALNPYTRIVTVQCIGDHMTPAYLDRLTGLLHESTDVTTRASAAALLTKIDDPRAEVELRSALEDKERRVLFSALRGLAMKGDANARARFAEWYSDEETADREKVEILIFIAAEPRAEELKFLAGVLLDADTPPFMRISALDSLARHGDGSILSDLRQAEEASADPQEQKRIQGTIREIEERLDGRIPQ